MNTANIYALKKHFSGKVILPNDKKYEEVRNTMAAQGSPAIVAQPANNQDIAVAIKFAVDNNLILSVRSGGHSVAGFSTNDGGLVIDLAGFNQIKLLDKNKGLVRIGAGSKWAEVAKFLQQYGLAISSGDTKTVGVGGLTTGGGIGWMVRKYGLAIDSMVAAELVTADGKTVHVSNAENPDLFWAIRGGGGNFGIATYFEFIAHPVGKVYAGPIIFSLDNVGELLKSWRDYMRTADDDLTIIINILPSFFGNPPMFMMTCCYANDSKKAAQKVINDLKALGNIVSEDVKEKHYSEVLEDAHPPEGIKIIVKNVFIEYFSDEIIDTIVKAHEQKPDILLQIRSLGGAMSKVNAADTAFGHRNDEVLIISPTFLPPTATDNDTKKALEAWETIASFGNGCYSGFTSTATSEDVANIYPRDIMKRLALVKKQHDPNNVFKQNYNIKPA